MSTQQQISWGKIIAGAAVAAGAVAVVAFCPEATASVGGAIKSGISAIFGGLGSVGSWIAEHVAQIAQFTVDNKPLAIGTAALAGGLMGARHGASSSPKNPEAEGVSERGYERESWAMREQIRSMQALMAARMAAQGYQPAMAMATGQRRP